MKPRISASGVTFLALICFSSQTTAGNLFATLDGTYSVNFQPITSAGVLQGCSLIFNAVILGHVYLNGSPVLAVGNVTYFQTNNSPGLSLKLGLNELLSGKTEPPYYAYLKTKNGTTSGVKFLSAESDLPGYKMFIYQIDPKSTAVLTDLLDGQNPTIAFNRKENGLDATFQLDLNVADTTEYSAGKLQHIYSNDAIDGFSKCFVELAATLSLDRK